MSACLLALSLIVGVVHATAPHPRVRQMIKQGIIPEPYYLKHLHELRARGVNAPWAAPELLQKRAMALTPPARSLGPAQVPTGEYKALVILVDFSDKTQQEEPAFFDSLVFSTTGVSAWDYYQAVSYDNLDIVTVNLPSTLGWVRVDSAYSYYVDGQNGFGPYPVEPGDPGNAQKLVEDVVNAADTQFPALDFSQYDNDGDGYVDALFVVHAGPGAEYTLNDNDIWSHAWATHYPYPVLDGVTIYRYSMEPEYWDAPGDMTIGVYAHEMGHSVFGLPDLYDYDDPPNDSYGLGRWSLMAGGSWNGTLGDSPAFPDAWCHYQMGYVTPTPITANTSGQTIANIESSAKAYRLWTNGTYGNEYFLVENRQQIGYDAALPGSGLLIYHVDEAVFTDNDNQWYPGYTDYGHYLVALEQADGLWELERALDSGDDGDPYPGYWNNTTFDLSSTPSSRDYDANNTYVAVRNISSSGPEMMADFFVLPVEVAPPQPVAINDVPEDQGGWVTATWAASEDDSDNSPNPVLFYSIWMKDTDGGGDAAPPLTVRLPEGSAPETVTLAADGWIGVGSLGAIQDSSYRFLVHTLQDSNQTGINWTYVRISAHADPYVYSFSAVDSGYSVDNIVPGVPADLAAAPVETGIRLSWYYDLEAVEDFQYFAIYRSEEAAFEPVHPDSATYLTEDTVFVDEKVDYGVGYYYRVAAIDYNGNYSDLTDAVFGAGLPEAFALRQNYPNPFNLSTTLQFDLPRLTRVSIIVYDLRGREVVRLFDGLHPSGCDQVEWDGQSADDRGLSSGVYIARMVIPPSEGGTPGSAHSVKMLLLK